MQSEKIKLINADCLHVLKELKDNSVDLVLTDPPYFQVKDEAWDKQWGSENSYMSWLESVLIEIKRVLKGNGSLYMFCGSRLAAETEILIKKHMNVLNHIVWAKPSGVWNKTRKEEQRMFRPATERIIFAEHRCAEKAAGYSDKCQELRSHVFAPLIEYFKNARESLGISAKEINEATGTQMCSHWFSYSQWILPSEVNYALLQELFLKKEKELKELNRDYSSLHVEYKTLQKTYNELKKEYKSLRRPFYVTKEVPTTDVWHFKSVQYYAGKHTCEKPRDMLEHMINASTNKGALVLDCFMGSGSTGKACLKLGRKFIGIELEQARFNQTKKEIKELMEQTQ